MDFKAYVLDRHSVPMASLASAYGILYLFGMVVPHRFSSSRMCPAFLSDTRSSIVRRHFEVSFQDLMMAAFAETHVFSTMFGAQNVLDELTVRTFLVALVFICGLQRLRVALAFCAHGFYGSYL